jgi:recombination protein RecT
MTEITPRKQKATQIRDLLEKSKSQIAMALPKHITPERMMRIAMTAIQRTPSLMECEPMSLLAAIVEASQLGLEIGVLGQAYLVPFSNKKTGRREAQLIVGYRGLISLARRSGEIVALEAHVVHERDRFAFSYGTDGRLEHEPCLDGDPGPVRAAYAYARLKDCGYTYDVLPLAELDKVRGTSKSANEGPWISWTEEMQRKTAVKRLCKYLPLSVEMARAIELDNNAEAGLPQDLGDEVLVLNEPEESKLAILTEKLKSESGTSKAGEPTPESRPAPPPPAEMEEMTENPAVRCSRHHDVDLTVTNNCWKCHAEGVEKAEERRRKPSRLQE